MILTDKNKNTHVHVKMFVCCFTERRKKSRVLLFWCKFLKESVQRWIFLLNERVYGFWLCSDTDSDESL